MIGRILDGVVVGVLTLQHEASGQCEHQELAASNGNSEAVV